MEHLVFAAMIMALWIPPSDTAYAIVFLLTGGAGLFMLLAAIF